MANLEDDLSHPRALLRPCLLLLLAERPGHGYDLVERLKPMGFDWGGPGPLYQTMRRMEDAGWVESTWDASETGPARRTYELTAEGRDTLAAWSTGLERLTELLAQYHARYGALMAPPGPPVAPASDPPSPAVGAAGEPRPPGEAPDKPLTRPGGRRVIPFSRSRRASRE